MRTRATSTAFSDLILAGCSLYAALNVRGMSGCASLGMVCVALAASLGVLRFGVVFPNFQSEVIRSHKLFAWIAAVLGIPFIGAGFCFYHHKPANAKFHLMSSVIALAISLIHSPVKEMLTRIVSTLAVLGIVFVTFMSSNFYATAGALAYGLACVVESISFLGLPGVDWFHYMLAGGNLLLMHGFIK